MVENQICTKDFTQVFGGRFVKVGIDSTTHEVLNLDFRRHHSAYRFSEHLGRTQNFQDVGGRFRFRALATSQTRQREEPQRNHEKQA